MQYAGTRHRQIRSQVSATSPLLDPGQSPPPSPQLVPRGRVDFLPSSQDARYTKQTRRTPTWLSFLFPKPRLPVFHSEDIHGLEVGRMGWTSKRVLFGAVGTLFVLYWLVTTIHGTRSTLVFRREDLQRIWRWEVASGHYPSHHPIPIEIQLHEPPENPALPPQRHRPTPPESYNTHTRGTGAKRAYLTLQARPENVGFPPRPAPGSIIDFDEVMRRCAYEHDQAAPDCLDVLRIGAGLDNGRRVRQPSPGNSKYIYQEVNETSSFLTHHHQVDGQVTELLEEFEHGLRKHPHQDWEIPPINLPSPPPYSSPSASPNRCQPDTPRIFHIFWRGDFTDKPYLIILSFLFTQNLGLHLDPYPSEAPCRPQFWVWIDPEHNGLSSNAAEDFMLDILRKNPWSSPFLHPRFKDVIRFKLWNTIDQLDNTPELKSHWRTHQVFRSNSRKVALPDFVTSSVVGTAPISSNWTVAVVSKKNSKVSVTLSDMVRFILCHRYGGIYLDADSILLRDWEEIWGRKGAFAYRWSRLPRYNTAVLRLNKGSALGSFILKTAVKNDFDFHPVTVTKYVKDAYLQDLLLEVPDALFDPAWLGVEGWQSRLAQPAFKQFSDFFTAPTGNVAAPQVLGFEGFFRGAYSYHYHNHWWESVDPARNWPSLGPRFVEGERLVRRQMHLDDLNDDNLPPDDRDLAWVTVLKRIMESYIRGERPNMYGEMIQW